MPIKYRRACLQVCIHKVVYYHAYFLDCHASLAMTEWTFVCFIIPQWRNPAPNLHQTLNPRQQSLRAKCGNPELNVLAVRSGRSYALLYAMA